MPLNPHALLKMLAISGLAAMAVADPLSSLPNRTIWTPDRNVNTILTFEDTVYLGGEYTYVGPQSGHFAVVDSTTGTSIPGFPVVNGDIEAIHPDGQGGWFIGGNFTRVGDEAREKLARILADGTVSQSFKADVEGDKVYALSVENDTLYVGGDFRKIAKESRTCIAALEVETGTPTSWAPTVRVSVRALVVTGDNVIAGGSFQEVNRQPRRHLVALDRQSGIARDWPADIDGNVNDIEILGNTLYISGEFKTVGGLPRSRLAAIDVSSGALLPWDPQADKAVLSMSVMNNTVYVGGDFSQVGGEPRGYLAALDAVTGQASAWNPVLSARVGEVSASTSGIYISGGFLAAGEPERRPVSALDAHTAEVLPWKPRTQSQVLALATDGNRVAMGGYFHSAGGVYRNHLSSLQLSTGTATTWNPRPNRAVITLTKSDDVLYVGGFFTDVGGVPRNRLAAFDLATGILLDWNPDVNGPVYSMAYRDGIVYAGGDFYEVGGERRVKVAAIDAITGSVLPWNSHASGDAVAMALWQERLYLGGSSSRSRGYLASIDLTTGIETDWNYPRYVNALLIREDMLFVGSYPIPQAGATLEAFDIPSGDRLPPLPTPSYTVHSLALQGDTLYIGGRFSRVNGQPHQSAAAIDIASGSLLPWNPKIQTGVFALAPYRDGIFAGGDFVRISGERPAYFADFRTDNSAPTLLSVTPVESGPSNLTSQPFRFKFDEPIERFDALEDLQVEYEGITYRGQYVVPILPVRDTFMATIHNLAGEGRLSVSIKAANGVIDMAGNALREGDLKASILVDTVPPTIGNLNLSQNEAATGDLVILNFDSSEPLAEGTVVSVNGHPARASTKASNSFEYTVLPGDQEGHASITIQAFDLAGNSATLQDNSALKIINAAASVPLRAWPLIAALLLAATFVLRGLRTAGAHS